jgi:hypothetical protein
MSKDHLCEDCGEALCLRTYVRRTRVGRYKVDDGSQLVSSVRERARGAHA